MSNSCCYRCMYSVCTTGTLHNGANSSGFFGVKLSSLTSKQIFYRQFAKGFELNIICVWHQANLDELTLYIKQTQMSWPFTSRKTRWVGPLDSAQCIHRKYVYIILRVHTAELTYMSSVKYFFCDSKVSEL